MLVARQHSKLAQHSDAIYPALQDLPARQVHYQFIFCRHAGQPHAGPQRGHRAGAIYVRPRVSPGKHFSRGNATLTMNLGRR